MTLSIEQNVLWLQVPVDDVLVMQCFNSTNNLSSIQLCSLLREPLLFPQVCKQLTAIQKINEEVQLGLSLESIVQANNVGVLYLLENVSLS